MAQIAKAAREDEVRNLLCHYGALLVGAECRGRLTFNPSDDVMPQEGDRLYVIASERVQLVPEDPADRYAMSSGVAWPA